MEQSISNTTRRMAILAGASLVAMAVLAGYAYGYIFSGLYVAGDDVATQVRLKENPGGLQQFLGAFLLILLLDVVVAWALYRFFEGFSRNLALLAGGIRIVYALLLGVALLPLAKMASYSTALEAYDAFLFRWSFSLIVFGGHLWVLGLVAWRSGVAPKVLAALLLLAAVCYVVTNTANCLLPAYAPYKATVDAVLGLPMAAGELWLAGWLLWRGGRGPITG